MTCLAHRMDAKRVHAKGAKAQRTERVLLPRQNLISMQKSNESLLKNCVHGFVGVASFRSLRLCALCVNSPLVGTEREQTNV